MIALQEQRFELATVHPTTPQTNQFKTRPAVTIYQLVEHGNNGDLGVSVRTLVGPTERRIERGESE